MYLLGLTRVLRKSDGNVAFLHITGSRKDALDILPMDDILAKNMVALDLDDGCLSFQAEGL